MPKNVTIRLDEAIIRGAALILRKAVAERAPNPDHILS